MDIPESIKEAVNKRVCELSGEGESIDFYVLNKVEEYAEELMEEKEKEEIIIALISRFNL